MTHPTHPQDKCCTKKLQEKSKFLLGTMHIWLLMLQHMNLRDMMQTVQKMQV
jgi:hypothetical protein